MDHDRAFLEAIQEHPDDDLHRLAWADWLEERGNDARAAFLRAQLRLARLPEDDPARDPLEDEADDLLIQHEGEWARGIAERALEWSWSRGCIESITVRGQTLLEHGEALFASMPIRRVRIVADREDLPRLAGLPLLERIEGLELGQGTEYSPYASPYLRDRPVQTLLGSRFLTRLVDLGVAHQGLEGPVIQTLIDTGLLDRLRRLDLSGNHAIGDRAIRLLAGAPAGRLEALGLTGANPTPAGLRALLGTTRHPALRTLEVDLRPLFPRGVLREPLERELLQSPLVNQLTSLRFDGQGVEVDALVDLLQSSLAARLYSLQVSGCCLGKIEAELLASSANLRNLRRLDLRGNGLRDSGARALAESPHLRHLTRLTLANNGIGSPGLKALLGPTGLARLTRLDLAGNHVGTPGADILTAIDEPRRLTHLNLSGANLDHLSLRVLVASPALSRARVLWLTDNGIGDLGVVALASSPHLPRLQRLHLDSIGMGLTGARALMESPHLRSLHHLTVRNEDLTEEDRLRLRARFGPGTHC